MSAPTDEPAKSDGSAIIDKLVIMEREGLKAAARRAMDKLSGPARIEVISHYLGSAKKAVHTAREHRPWFCEECGETADRCACVRSGDEE